MHKPLLFLSGLLISASCVARGGGASTIGDARREARDDRRDAVVDASSKWDKLGERWVNGGNDVDVIPVGGRDVGAYRRVKIVVEHSALEMFDIVVTFANGQTWSPGTRLIFGQGTTSRTIDLPGEARSIQQVAFHYGNLPGGGRAQLELWGLHN